VPRLCEFYPGVCLTTEEKAWKKPHSGGKTSAREKILSQCRNADEGRHIGQIDAAVTFEPRSLHRLLTNEFFYCFLESVQANTAIFPRSQRDHLEILSNSSFTGAA